MDLADKVAIGFGLIGLGGIVQGLFISHLLIRVVRAEHRLDEIQDYEESP